MIDKAKVTDREKRTSLFRLGAEKVLQFRPKGLSFFCDLPVTAATKFLRSFQICENSIQFNSFWIQIHVLK
jgi:hypothetical protein